MSEFVEQQEARRREWLGQNETYPIPLGGGRYAHLSVPRNATAADYARIARVLESMAPDAEISPKA